MAKILGEKNIVQQSKAMQTRVKNFQLLTIEDPAREKYGAAKDSHPKEFQQVLRSLEIEGVDIDLSRPMMAYSPAKGRSGRFILDENASISALRHEYKHFLDDKAAGYPGLKH